MRGSAQTVTTGISLFCTSSVAVWKIFPFLSLSIDSIHRGGICEGKNNPEAKAAGAHPKPRKNTMKTSSKIATARAIHRLPPKTIRIGMLSDRTASASALTPKADEMPEKLRLRYPAFEAVLKFVKRRKLPTGKCEVWASPRGHESCPHGYTNGQDHVAAVICFALEEEAQGEGQFEASELDVRRENGFVHVCIDDWRMISLEPLSAAEIKKVRQKHGAKRGRSAKKATLKTPSKRGKSKDPFEIGLSLYPYMPGGEWA